MGAMRALFLYVATITTVIWVASVRQHDREHLPIKTPRAPIYTADLSLPDPTDPDNLSVVPAAQAGGRFAKDVYVQGSVVNMRSGPGLSYRMIDVVERGDQLQVDGEWRGDWAPVYDLATGINGWIHGADITRQPLR